MQAIFVELLHMSILASIAIGLVVIARAFFGLMRVPKKLTYILWIIPFIRLVCPFAFESNLSIMPERIAEYSPEETLIEKEYLQYGQYDEEFLSGEVWNYESQIGSEKSETITENSIQGENVADNREEQKNTYEMSDINNSIKTIDIISLVWVVGVCVITLFGIGSFLRIKKRLIGSVSVSNDVYVSDYLDTAFVMGVIRPRIYAPSYISDEELEYVVSHERQHIRRRDYIIKPIAYFITAVHWFNPIVWLAYYLLVQDMEMSCDEGVIGKIGLDKRDSYAKALLNISSERVKAVSIPIAFAEGSTERRVKNIMKAGKPIFFVCVIAVVMVVVLGVVLLTNPSDDNIKDTSVTEPELITSEETTVSGDDMYPDGENYSYERDISSAYIKEDMTIGADGPILDYVDDHKVIFHGYVGLFVYSLDDAKILDSIDLESIGCNTTQGDNACNVTVSSDGRYVYFTKNEADVYRYDTVDHKLVYAQGHEMLEESTDNIFMGLLPSDKYINLSENGGFTSRNCVEVTDGVYGYLECQSGLWKDICYVESDMVYMLYECEEQLEDLINDMEENVSEQINQ